LMLFLKKGLNTEPRGLNNEDHVHQQGYHFAFHWSL
jgi:hypothetical protein